MISPLLSNLYLNEVDKMLERAREVTRNGKYTNVEYARFADDLVVLINAYKRHDWLIGAVNKPTPSRLPIDATDLQSRSDSAMVKRGGGLKTRSALPHFHPTQVAVTRPGGAGVRWRL